MELYKTEIKEKSYENQFKFTKLHEKRIIVIEKLFKKLIVLGKDLKDFTDSKTKGNYDETKLDILADNWKQFNEYFKKNEIYFSKEITLKIYFLIDFIQRLINSFNVQILDKYLHLEIEKSGDMTKEIEKEFKKIKREHDKDDNYFVNEYIPEIENELKEILRGLIGVY